MNDKLIKVGKSTLAAVMASSMSFNTISQALPILAQENSDVPVEQEVQEPVTEVVSKKLKITSATAKSLGPSNDGDSLQNSLDGDPTTYTNNSYWDPNSIPQEYYLGLDQYYNVDKVRVHPRQVDSTIGNGAPNRVEVYASTDGGSTYTLAADQAIDPTYLGFTDITFNAVKANAVKLVLYSEHPDCVSTGEVEVWGSDIVEQPTIDYTLLDKSIKKAQEYIPNKDTYTETTWKAFEEAYNSAVAAKENTSLTQDDVNKLAENLTKAIFGLRKDPNKPQPLEIATEKVLTERNTVIVKLSSNELLQSPDSDPISNGKDLMEEANQDGWVYDYIDGKYVYAREYAQNGAYEIECEDIYGTNKTVTVEISEIVEERKITFNNEDGAHRYADDRNSYIIIAYGADWVEYNGKRYSDVRDDGSIWVEAVREDCIAVPKGTMKKFTLTAGFNDSDEVVTYTWYEDKKNPELKVVEETAEYVLFEADEKLTKNSDERIEVYEEEGRYFAKVKPTEAEWDQQTVYDNSIFEFGKPGKNATWLNFYIDEQGICRGYIADENPESMSFVMNDKEFNIEEGMVITKNYQPTLRVRGKGVDRVRIGTSKWSGDEYKVGNEGIEVNNSRTEMNVPNITLKDKSNYFILSQMCSEGNYSFADEDIFKFTTDFSKGSYVTTLKETLDGYKSKELKQEDYTEASWNAYQTALNEAWGSYYDLTNENAEMKQAEAKLNEAFGKLEENNTEALKALNDKIAKAEEVLEIHGGKYGSEYKDRVAKFKEAIQAAKDVAAKQGVTSKECEEATNELQAAMDEYSKRDTTKLQAEIEKYKDFTSAHSNFKYFESHLKTCQRYLENPDSVAQYTIDSAAINIETKVYMVKVSELNSIYSPTSKTPFDYSKYTVESAAAVLNMYGITHNRTNGNYSEIIVQDGENYNNPDLPGQMKGWYEQYQEAINVMEASLIPEDAQYLNAPNEALQDAMGVDEKQGTFKVVDEKHQNGKTVLTVQFINTGIHPIYGKELPNANGSTKFEKFSGDLEDGSFGYYGYTSLDTGWASSSSVKNVKAIKVDGNSAIQGTIELDSNIKYITLKYSKNRDESFSGWAYRIGEQEAEPVIVVNINGEQFGGENFADTVGASGILANDVENVEVLSGKLTVDDLAYINTLKNLTNLVMNLDEDLLFVGTDGQPSTILPENAFKGNHYIESLSITGFTEVGKSAFENTYIEKFTMPDVKVIGETAFKSNRAETLDLPNVVEIGVSAFNGNENITSITMPKVETIKQSAFYRASDFEEFTLPSTIKFIGANAFKAAASGRRTLDVTIEKDTPPEVEKGAFESGTIMVPEGSLPNYLTELDLTETFITSGSSKWNNLTVIDSGYHDATYFYKEGSTAKVYGYIKDGARFDSVEVKQLKAPEGKVFKEWNTEKDGTGKVVLPDQIVTEDLTVYAIFEVLDTIAPEVTVTTSNNNGSQVTNKDVTVTLTANEAIQSVEGWRQVNETTLEKTFSENGKHQVTVTDLAGNETLVKFEVKRIDKVAPVINAEDVTLTVGDEFDPMEGVTATDNVDNDLTEEIVVSGDKVDATKAGTYKVTYIVQDAAGNETSKTITVTVNPKMEVINAIPTIKAEDKTITVGDTFDPMTGVTASDKEDGDITKNIKVILNTVDTTKPGNYLVTYKVTDSVGLSTSKTITVTVKEEVKTPVDENKPDDKDKGTNTGVGVSTGLFAGLASISALGLGVLEALKRRKK